MVRIKIGNIICDRYLTCAGGKCFNALQKRDGAFSIYKNSEAEIAAFTTCGRCLGSNIEYASEEMNNSGVMYVHFATGFLVGYPPCPYMEHFQKFIPVKYGMKVILATHPITQKYFITHNTLNTLNTWNTVFLQEAILPTLSDEQTRLKYD